MPKNISFSQNVKNELIGAELSEAQKSVLLSGIVYGMRRFDDELALLTENPRVIAFMKRLFPQEGLTVSEQPRKDAVQYTLKMPCGENEAEPTPHGDDSAAGVFLRGVFIACGVATNPDRSYHLELTLPSAEKCLRLKSFIEEHGIAIRVSTRKGQSFLYSKESEGIADFLTYIGAPHSSMEIMNVKIFKEVRNNVNRAVNCEAANLEKTVYVAEKQAEDIRFVFAEKGRDYLSDELLEVADLRLSNIDMSLREIGEQLKPKLSRSGVNHRLRKISEIARRLRDEK